MITIIENVLKLKNVSLIIRMNQEKKRVLVTGGYGLVGSAIKTIVNQNKNKDDYLFVSSKEVDLRSREQTFEIFNEFKPTHVIHLAAFTGGLYKQLAQSADFYRINTLINDNVLSISQQTGVLKVVSCLSTCMFPDKTEYPLDETMIHNGPPSISNSSFAYAKRMVDIQNRAYFNQFKVKYTSVIPTCSYGPNDNFHLQDGHVIPSLIHKCYIAKQKNTDFVVNGTGKALRGFIYSFDLAKLILWALENYDEIEPIILSVNEDDEISIKEAVNEIVKALNFEGKVLFDSSKTDGQIKKTASISKLRKYLPKYEFYSFRNGIQETCDWFVENYESARK